MISVVKRVHDRVGHCRTRSDRRDDRKRADGGLPRTNDRADPVDHILGEHDAGFIRRHSPKLATDLPNATVQEVPDAGHTSNLDNPEFFTATL